MIEGYAVEIKVADGCWTYDEVFYPEGKETLADCRRKASWHAQKVKGIVCPVGQLIEEDYQAENERNQKEKDLRRKSYAK